ncbi:MAG: hypothetical protein GX945_13980 [Lentisphaerae bacterium]|jgi:hypothetical protein|nr:hypothetical protein [Lentisphaerota bacterium]
MSIKTLTIIALRLLAVIIFTQFLGLLPIGIGYVIIQAGTVLEATESYALPMFLAQGVYLLVVALFYLVTLWALLWRTAMVADFLLRDVGEERLKALPDLEMLSALVCHCFGLYALLRWLPPLAHGLLGALLQRWRSGGDGGVFFQERMFGQVGPAIGVLLGVVLLLHGTEIARLLAPKPPPSAQTEGTPSPSVPTEDTKQG